MRQLIEYQQGTGAKRGGPAWFEPDGPRENCLPLVLPALAGRDGEGVEIREASPEAPPTTPYRGVPRHTDQDFGLIKTQKIAFPDALARGSGERTPFEIYEG
nr:hypothetical protein [uncultured Cohaesibacter sp.]